MPTISTPAIDGLQLADALRSGIYRLFGRTAHINHINVFPVPDGDTGTNLAMTLSAVLTALDRQRSADAGQVLTLVADAALDGARGNSGAILAQFFLGLADRTTGVATLTPGEFALALVLGARYARDAMAEPREGTLLTVLAAFADEAARRQAASGYDDFHTLFSAALPEARRSLAATQEQLEALRMAGVVDAGALGFVELLEGMAVYFETGVVAASVAPSHEPDEAMASGASTEEFRYCVECMIHGEAIALRSLKETLGTL